MAVRLFTPLRIVLLLFVGAAVLVLAVAVYQAQRGPLMQQEKIRAEEVRQVLESVAANAAPIMPDADQVAPSALASGDAPIVEALQEFEKQTRRQFPYWYFILDSPCRFPADLISDLEREIAQNRSFADDEKKWLDDYDNGRLSASIQAVLKEMPESERAETRAKRQKRLDKSREALESQEKLLAQINERPESLWRDLLEYLQAAPVLRDIEQRGASLAKRSALALYYRKWFALRSILETHAGRYDAALSSYELGASRSMDENLFYIVDQALLTETQRARLLKIISSLEPVNKPSLNAVRTELRLLAAAAEAPLDLAEMAQLKLDSSKDTTYRSPLEIAGPSVPEPETSLDEELQRLLDAQREIRAISSKPYASSSPSFLGPKGKLARYAGYLSNSSNTETKKDIPPALLTTANFVEKAIACVEGHMQSVRMVDVTRTALAVKDFERANGRLPNSLNEVVPDFIQAIPVVAGTGKPLGYSPPKGRENDRGFRLTSEPITPGGRSQFVWLSRP